MSEHIRENAQEEQEQLKLNALKRMKRIEGQVRGIQRMIEEGKECEDILVQVKAVTSALQSSTKVIMRRFLLRCVAEADDSNLEQQEELEKFVRVMMNYMH